MLSKNNYHEKFRKMEPRKERFSIRKFSIGAASVLIGFSFMSMAGNQKAQAAEQQEKPAVVQNAKDNEQSQSSAGATLEAKMGGVNSATTANKTATDSKLTQSPIQDSTHSSANTEANKLTKSANSNVQAGQSNDLTISNKEDSTNVENKTAVLNTDKKQTSLTKDSLRDEKVAAVESTATKNLRGTQSQDVNDWQGFVNAMNDSSVGTIKLTSDITVANKGTNVNGIHRPQPLINSGKMNLTGSNISGGLDIDGQNHTINFGANYLSFDTNNQKNSNPWDIAFKNLTINADGYDNSWGTLGGAFSPIYMGGDDIKTNLLAKNKVTFENVTADVKNGAFYNTTMAQQVTDNPYTTLFSLMVLILSLM